MNELVGNFLFWIYVINVAMCLVNIGIKLYVKEPIGGWLLAVGYRRHVGGQLLCFL